MTNPAISLQNAMRSARIAVKGIRNGVLFMIADDEEFADVYRELAEKVQGDRRETSVGTTAVMTVYLDFGERELTSEQETSVRELFASTDAMLLGGLNGLPAEHDVRQRDPYVLKGTVRSGQVVEHDGDIVVIGDVNPGAQLISSGDIYVMGFLRGSAHAGASGNLRAIVAATYFDPIQVRIAGVIRRAPERHVYAAEMEFAYLDGDQQMAIDKMEVLGQYRARMRSALAVV